MLVVSSQDVMFTAPIGDQPVLAPDGYPYPPFELANRVGSVPDFATYHYIGASAKEYICKSLPMNYDFQGKRILDFGCGAGRVLRHFVPEAKSGCEVWGCDIDMPSVLWAIDHFSPLMHIFHNSEQAHLPLESNSFDCVFAFSVFSHLSHAWDQWLAELRRVLVANLIERAEALFVVVASI